MRSKIKNWQSWFVVVNWMQMNDPLCLGNEFKEYGTFSVLYTSRQAGVLNRELLNMVEASELAMVTF